MCILHQSTLIAAGAISRRARPLAARYEKAVEFASKSTNSEQLDMAYDTDTEQDEVMDSEQSELEEQILSARDPFTRLTKSKPRGRKTFGEGERRRPSAIRS